MLKRCRRDAGLFTRIYETTNVTFKGLKPEKPTTGSHAIFTK